MTLNDFRQIGWWRRFHLSPLCYGVRQRSFHIGKALVSRTVPFLILLPYLSPIPSAFAQNVPSNAQAYGSSWACNHGYKKNSEGTGCEKIDLPPNATLDGWRWACNQGYRQNSEGTGCEKIDVPSNATLDGRNWACNNGFKKNSEGTGCIEIAVPLYARAYGSSWLCNHGYKKNSKGTGCEKIDLPPNARVDGSGWDCDYGYERNPEGTRCLKIDVPPNAYLNKSKNWICKNGYKMNPEATGCVEVDAPPNAQAYGSHWICNIGFRQVGDSCQELTPEEQAKLIELKSALVRFKNMGAVDGDSGGPKRHQPGTRAPQFVSGP
jgi:hypothetical protein